MRVGIVILRAVAERGDADEHRRAVGLVGDQRPARVTLARVVMAAHFLNAELNSRVVQAVGERIASAAVGAVGAVKQY